MAWRHLDAGRARHFMKVDDELKFGRLQDWQFGGLGALTTLPGYLEPDLTKRFCEVGSVTHQPPSFHSVTDTIGRRGSCPAASKWQVARGD